MAAMIRVTIARELPPRRHVEQLAHNPANDDQLSANHSRDEPLSPDVNVQGRSGVVRMGKAFGQLIPPASLVAGLLIYTGWVRTRAYFTYFGISPDFIPFTPQDYILRSADVGLNAAFALALGVVSILALNLAAGFLIDRLSARSSRRVGILGATLGAGLAVGGLYASSPFTSVSLPVLLSAGLIALGVLILLRCAPLLTMAEVPASITLTMVALMGAAGLAATTIYAQDHGTSAARSIDTDPRSLASVTIYSEEPLDITGGNVSIEGPIAEGEKTYYRYVGAQLLQHASDRWFLITDPPGPDYHSRVLILPDSESIRFDVLVPR